LAAALIVNDPLPVPLAPLVTASHGTVVLMVQAQPAGAVTVLASVPPSALNVMPSESTR
jgi:hypothetical protein